MESLKRKDTYNKLRISAIKSLIKTFSKKQKDKKIEFKNFILDTSISRSHYRYKLSSFQLELFENSNYLTSLHQEYSSLRGKKCSNILEKDNRELPKLRVLDIFDYKTNILYLENGEFLIDETLYITKEGYQIKKTDDFTKELKIDDKRIYFVSEDMNDCIDELNKIKDVLDSSEKVNERNEYTKERQKVYSSIRASEEKLNKKHHKELDLLNEKNKKVLLKINKLKDKEININKEIYMEKLEYFKRNRLWK